MPVGADPITYVLHKMEALGEAYLTITDKFELPLNHGSHLALSHYMPTGQCTQCHNMENRVVTPSDGIIIDHAIHDENEVACTWCHNRIAHPEDFELTLTDPATGEPNTKHDDFMGMTACFRCHGLEADAEAPGACSKCHPAGFELKPPNHFAAGFYPRGHADMALEEVGLAGDDDHGEEEIHETTEAEEVHEEAVDTHDEPGLALPAVSEINYCSTCHLLDVFCMNCHGMEIPHPEDFKTEKHPQVVAASYDKCVLCHNPEETFFCDDCHHGTKVAWDFDTAEPWTTQHAKNVSSGGVAICLEACHEVKFCSDCHTAMSPYPSSHKQADWLRRASFEARAVHAETAKSEITGCEVCHGEGGTESKFCKSCHVFEIPHPDEFRERHAKTGRDNAVACANCHTFPELCSNCHHAGASEKTPWANVHPQAIIDGGVEPCLACHEKAYCVDCHTTLSAVPVSHKPGDWTYRATEDGAKHPAAYDASADSCTYCHGDGGAAAKFCMSCHKVEMPHPSDFGTEDDGGIHQAGFQDGSLKRATCDTCHQVTLCNGCHHTDATGAKPWQYEHPDVVKADGADGCFDCHEPTSCAYCHVRLVD